MSEPVEALHRGDHTTAEALSAVPLDGSGASLAFEVDVRGYAVLEVHVNHSAHVSSSDITMTATTSPDGGVTDYELQSVLVTLGIGTSSDASWTKTIAGVKKFVWQVGVIGYKSVTCTLASTGAAAGDLVSVTTRTVTQ